jgi:hypothetical protein
VEEVFDIHQVVDARLAGRQPEVRVAGVDLGSPLPESGIPKARFDQIVDATTCRVELVPRLRDTAAHRARRAEVAQRSREFARVYDALLGGNDVVALVSSHVDYNNFGLAVEAALRHGVRVLFPQSTGTSSATRSTPQHSSPTSRCEPV